MGKTEASLTLASPSSPKMGLALSPRREGRVLQCGHKKGGDGGERGWGGRGVPALLAPGQSQGSSPFGPLKSILWVFPSSFLTGCLLSKARGHAEYPCVSNSLLIPFPQAQASHRGAPRLIKQIPSGKVLPAPSLAHKQEVICRDGRHLCGHFLLTKMLSVEVS